MNRLFTIVCVASLTISGAAHASGGGGTGTFAGLSLSISKETAPAGSLAQMKVYLTEPKPVSTGTGTTTFAAYDSLLGIALSPEAGDTTGIALVRGNNLALALRSTTSLFGTIIDYPILTVAGRVAPGAVVGTKFPMTIDPASLQMLDPTGALYPVEVKNGFLMCGANVSIGDVNPGSATVPAGGVVTITGANFVPGTNIKLATGKISQIRYVDSTRMDIVVAQDTPMHGMMIKASNPDNTQSTYFSYQRTRPVSPSADPVMQYAVPLVQPTTATAATVSLPAPAPSTTYGIALQNIEMTDATAQLDLLDSTGALLGTTVVVVPSKYYVVRETSELFGFAPAGPAAIRVTSNGPLEVVGVSADQVNGTAAPLP